VYPRAALRARLDGIVILEILVDSDGIIRGTRVLEETPPSRGFGAAASRAFDGIRALSPALLNGIPTASRYRYTLRFVCP
jgi:TonB family protein